MVNIPQVDIMLLSTIEDFSEYFRDVASLLEEFSWLFKIPVTDILIADVLLKIPHDWEESIMNLTNEELNNVPAGLIKECWPSTLRTFLTDCKRLSLPELVNKPPRDGCGDEWVQAVPSEMWRGMSQKKREEVEMMSSFVHQECKSISINHIVDLGSGLGYIDRLLLLHGYKILGIESQSKLVHFSTVQKNNLFPHDIAANINYSNLTIVEESILEVRNAINNNFFEEKILPRFIQKREDGKNYEKYDWKRLMPHFKDVSMCASSKKVCMIGLHTCGDLTVTALNMYLKLAEVSALVLIPCCYHKMALKEEPEGNKDDVEEKFYNIPLSESFATVCVKQRVSFICRPFLRLASQASNTGWLEWSEADHQQHSFNVLSRAVVELYAQQENATFKKSFRRLARKTTLKNQDFSTYVEEILNRSKFSDGDEHTYFVKNRKKIQSDLLSLWEQHRGKLRQVEILTALQMCLEPVIESLIVADRICYLREQKVNNVRVVRIIDSKLSPRCLAFVACKG